MPKLGDRLSAARRRQFVGQSRATRHSLASRSRLKRAGARDDGIAAG